MSPKTDGKKHLAETFDVKEWVSSKVYRRGVDYFRDGRVGFFELGDDDSIAAEVEGNETYSVDISWDDGEPIVECSCPYDWEPVCKHAVAAILFWQERGVPRDEEENADETDETAISFNRESHIEELAALERKKRCSKKLLESIRILKRPKPGLCGEYAITSGTSKTSYAVTVRDGSAFDHTTCNCPDYLINELGTCKHIELVREDVERKSKKRPSSAKDSRIWISLKPKDTYEIDVNPFEEINIHASDPAIRKKLFTGNGRMPWHSTGYLKETFAGTSAADKFKKVLRSVENCFGRAGSPQIIIAPEVEKLIAGMDADRVWKNRLDKIISSPEKSEDWTSLKKSLPVKLYDYQEEGILFAVRNRKSFIGDDMGLGKTVQAIVAALFIKKLGSIDRVLVFCPASLKYQWKREIEKFTSEKADIVSGGMLARREIYKKSGATFLIVNYELIFRDEEFFNQLKPGMVILDEAQRIKNWETKTAKGIKRLKSEFSLILTGTPFENRLVELHSLCEFLHPRALGPMWRLLPTYGNLDANEKLVGYSNLSQLRRKISLFFLRRDKALVLSQLPEKVINEYAIEVSSAQKKYHDDYEAKLARILSKAKKRPLTPEEMKRVFMCLTAMRIISNALAQHDWKKYRPIVDVPEALSLAQIRNFHSPKLMEFRSVMEELLDIPNAKFVVFSQWERMLLLAEASIRDLLMARKMEAVIFSGSLPSFLRPKVIDKFISDPKLRIFFSTDAGGLGLNLQESASYVMNLETPWNPAVLEQRIARVHRLGQKNTVNVINFISTECIEERVYAAVGNKKKLFDGLFDGKTDSVDLDKNSAFIERLKEIVKDVDDIDEDRVTIPSPLRGEGQGEGDSVTIPSPLRGEGQGEGDSVTIPSPSRGEGKGEGDPVTIPSPLRGEGKGEGDPSNIPALDLTGILKALGTWFGNKSLSNLPEGALKVGIERKEGDVKISLKNPPKDLAAGLKKALMSIAEMIGD